MTPKEINDENLEKASGGDTIIGNNRQQKTKREEGIKKVLDKGLKCPKCGGGASNSMEVVEMFDPKFVELKCKFCGSKIKYKWERFGL